MGQSSATPPAPPGLSAEEKALLEKQGVTLEQFNQLLSQSTTDLASNQSLLAQISGLYKLTKQPDKFVPPTWTTDHAAIDMWMDALDKSGKSSIALQNGRQVTKDELMAAKRDPAVAVALGLSNMATPPGSEPVPDKWMLDPDAVKTLKERVAAEQSKQQEILDLQRDRYIKALKGELPVSQGLMNQKAEEFKLLREGAARRGIMIDGTTPEDATSQTTAGNELVGQFKRTYGLLEDAERRGELMGGAPTGMPGYAQPLNFATSSSSSGPMGLLPTYSNLTSMYGGAAQPYQQQRLLGYQGQVAGYNAGRQNMAGLTGLLGTGAGAAMMAGGPWGWGIGAGLLGLGVAANYA